MGNSWSDTNVFVTGHTGFKGSWLSHLLLQKGARVTGLALEPDQTPALFDQLGLSHRMSSVIGDIRDAGLLRRTLDESRPDVVFHMAAQPLVRHSYAEPLETFDVNVMGTAHLLDALRGHDRDLAVVVVTTDKVYRNLEAGEAFREDDPLGGHDPYSASKAGAEIVVESYRHSFFGTGPVRLASARSGNVIGGGDWAVDRIVPDAMRAARDGHILRVRNPGAVRPWQHVLDALNGYMVLAEALREGRAAAATGFNFGPDPADQRTVRALLEAAGRHGALDWADDSDPAHPHEAQLLTLDISKSAGVLDWKPVWDFDAAVRHTVDWYAAVARGEDPRAVTDAQLALFEEALACR